MATRLKVTVTQDHISKAEANVMTCPFELAIKDMTGVDSGLSIGYYLRTQELAGRLYNV